MLRNKYQSMRNENNMLNLFNISLLCFAFAVLSSFQLLFPTLSNTPLEQSAVFSLPITIPPPVENAPTSPASVFRWLLGHFYMLHR